jgi:hypothetical protein
MKVYRDIGDKVPCVLFRALDGDEWSVSYSTAILADHIRV